MTIYKIWSQGDTTKNRIRTEYIDTSKNKLFKNNSQSELKRNYERFWSSEGVKVLKIKKVNIQSRGGNWGIKWLK